MDNLQRAIEPVWLSVRCAGLATALALLIGLPLAWLLARRNFPGRALLDSFASLPVLLPPAVFVYYLLAESGRLPLAFNWSAAIALSSVYTLPLLMRMSRAGLEAVDRSIENAARSLGASEWRVFWRISAPLGRRALWAAILAGFARSFVDFGLTAIAASRTSMVAAALLLFAAVAWAALYIGNRIQVRA